MSGSSLFATLARFQEEDLQINIEHFLKIVESFISLLLKVGQAFAAVVYDLRQSLQVVRDELEKNPATYLGDMLLQQKEDPNHPLIISVMWIRRNMYFVLYFFQEVVNNPGVADLKAMFVQSYDDTMEPFHGFLGIQLIKILGKFLPKRRPLLQILCNKNTESETVMLADMNNYIENIIKGVTKLREFYIANELETYLLV